MHPAALEITRKKIEELQLSNAHVTGADVHATSVSGRIVRCSILFGVVPAPVILELRLAFELYRVLKPGGTLAVWTLSPFWSPRVLIKHAPFGSAGCARKVHRLMKRDRYRFVILINRSRGTAYGHIKGELADGITCHMRESVSREAVNDDYVLHLIAANLIEGILKAANSPENAAGIVLEDPPLFSGEGERALQNICPDRQFYSRA